MTDQRLPSSSPETWDEDLAQLLSGGEIAGVRVEDMNLFRTLAVHPRLLRRYMAFGGQLLQRGELDPRERELLILRAAWLARCRYEWAQHVRISLDLGMAPDELERILVFDDRDPARQGWDPADEALLRAAGELHRDVVLSDHTWTELERRHSSREMVEIVMLVGSYRMLAGALNSIRIELEPGFERYAEAFDRALDGDQIR